LYVAPKPPTGDSKAQNGRFPCEIALHLKQVCFIVSLSEYCQRPCCKTFTILSIVQKWFAGDVRYCVKIWPKLTNPLKNRFQISIRS